MGGSDKKSFPYVPKIINGGFAGIVGVSCVFPIDLVKTRLQNQRVIDGKAQYSGILDCAKKTWHSGSGGNFSKFRGLYSGSAINIILITPEKAIKLVANDVFRQKLKSESESRLPLWKASIAGGLAGLFQITVTTPMELLKIQMQDQGRTLKPGQKKFTVVELITKIFREEGFKGFYRGVRSTMARDVIFSMLYFPLFAELDRLGPRKADGSGDAQFYVSFISGLAAGAFSSFAVTPLDVVKTRMQTATKGAAVEYKNVPHALAKIFKDEGPKALFKGAACRMMVMAPLFGIAQMVYYIGFAEKVLGLQKTAHI